jgi:hypothetical protein
VRFVIETSRTDRLFPYYVYDTGLDQAGNRYAEGATFVSRHRTLKRALRAVERYERTPS